MAFACRALAEVIDDTIASAVAELAAFDDRGGGGADDGEVGIDGVRLLVVLRYRVVEGQTRLDSGSVAVSRARQTRSIRHRGRRRPVRLSRRLLNDARWQHCPARLRRLD